MFFLEQDTTTNKSH